MKNVYSVCVCVCVFVHVRTFVYDVCVFVSGYYIKLVVCQRVKESHPLCMCINIFANILSECV